jgi:hypothetical protein
MPDSSHHVIGYIVACQEERFRVMNESGQTLLFTLANHAPIGLDDLNELQATHTRVRVDYTGEPNLASGIARTVQPL